MAGYTRYSALKSTMLLSALACSQPATLPTSETRLEIVSGNGQSGSAGFELAVPLVARLRDGNGDPVAGVTVHWGTGDREGRLTPATAVTGSDGIATAVWRLGRDDGPQRAVATYADRPGVNFNAASRSGDVLQAGGLPSRQCGVFSDDVVRCWQSPNRDAAALVSLDTDLRFASLGFAVDRWCGSTRGGAIACVLDAEMMPGGIFRPDAAPVRVLATNLPVMLRIAGVGTIEGGTTWCAQSVDQAVWCWGNNDRGQLGRGTIGGSSEVPMPVSGGLRVIAMAVTDGAACAIDIQNKPWCWGDSSDGVVPGDAPSAVPVAVPTGLRYLQIAGDGSGAVCALAPGQEIHCWGSNRSGGRGRSGPAASSQPTVIPGIDFFVALTSGSDGFLALTIDRTLVGWGGPAGSPLRDAPVQLDQGRVFEALLPGGGEARCVREYLGGTRCIDRVAMATGLAAGGPPHIYGIPGIE